MALGCPQGADVAVQHEVGVVVRFLVSVTSGSAAYTRSPTWREMACCQAGTHRCRRPHAGRSGRSWCLHAFLIGTRLSRAGCLLRGCWAVVAEERVDATGQQLLGRLRVQAGPERGPDDMRVDGQRVELDDRQLRVGHVQFHALCEVSQRGGDGRSEPLRALLQASSGTGGPRLPLRLLFSVGKILRPS